jgi:basic amino acid/polyamine antiporter, APA family
MPDTSQTAGTRRELARDLKVSHAGAIVVGTIIGSGIFLVPAEMMQAVGSSAMVYLAWIAGGLLSMFGALTYSELAAMKPQAGGEYVYMRDGYGPLGGFLYAWTYFVIAKPGSMASISTGFVRILSNLEALRFLGQTRADGWHPTVPGQAVAIAAILLISFINYIGVKKAGEFQLFFTLLKVALVLAIVGMGFAYAQGSLANFSTHYSLARGGMAGFMAALLASLWAYDGWNLVTTVSAEIRDPQRSLPRALIAGVATVAVLYMLLNAAVQYVIPAGLIARSTSPALDAIRWVGHGILAFVLVSMALAMLATLNGSTMTGARVPFAVARDGYFFSSLATVHDRYRTPSTAIVLQAVLAVGMLFFAGSFQQLFSLTLFAEWLFYMLTTGTIFIFRKREPDAPRPYRVWGYPLVPALFIAASAVLLCYTFAANVTNSVAGTLVILAGIPVYLLFRRKAQGARLKT